MRQRWQVAKRTKPTTQLRQGKATAWDSDQPQKIVTLLDLKNIKRRHPVLRRPSMPHPLTTQTRTRRQEKAKSKPVLVFRDKRLLRITTFVSFVVTHGPRLYALMSLDLCWNQVWELLGALLVMAGFRMSGSDHEAKLLNNICNVPSFDGTIAMTDNNV